MSQFISKGFGISGAIIAKLNSMTFVLKCFGALDDTQVVRVIMRM